jgi:hypothetical protein
VDKILPAGERLFKRPLLVLRAERRLLAGRGGAGSSLELGGDGVKQVLRQRKD